MAVLTPKITSHIPLFCLVMSAIPPSTNAPHPTQQPKISISLLIQMPIRHHCTTSNQLTGHVN
jgi:hypothetical protein